MFGGDVNDVNASNKLRKAAKRSSRRSGAISDLMTAAAAGRLLHQWKVEDAVDSKLQIFS